MKSEKNPNTKIKKNTQPIPDAQFTFARNKAFQNLKSNQIKSNPVISIKSKINPRLPQATVGPRSVVRGSSPKIDTGGEYQMIDSRWYGSNGGCGDTTGMQKPIIH